MHRNATKRFGGQTNVQFNGDIRNTHSLGGIRKKTYNYLKKISSAKQELMRRSFETDDIQIRYSQNKMEFLRRSLDIGGIKIYRNEKKRSSSEPPRTLKPMDETSEKAYYDNNPQLMELDYNFNNMTISHE